MCLRFRRFTSTFRQIIINFHDGGRCASPFFWICTQWQIKHTFNQNVKFFFYTISHDYLTCGSFTSGLQERSMRNERRIWTAFPAERRVPFSSFSLVSPLSFAFVTGDSCIEADACWWWWRWLAKKELRSYGGWETSARVLLLPSHPHDRPLYSLLTRLR